MLFQSLQIVRYDDQDTNTWQFSFYRRGGKHGSSTRHEEARERLVPGRRAVLQFRGLHRTQEYIIKVSYSLISVDYHIRLYVFDKKIDMIV